MTDPIISKKIARIAKEKGFEQDEHPVRFVWATQSLLQRWLIEVHSIFCSFELFLMANGELKWLPIVIKFDKTAKDWNFRISANLVLDHEHVITHNKHYNAMEQALEIGLNLIP